MNKQSLILDIVINYEKRANRNYGTKQNKK
jgi:hypothetical protein